LLEADKRRVSLGFKHSTADIPVIPAVIPWFPQVHVSPFIGCPAKDYVYWFVSRAVTWTIDATAIGFLVPSFRWTIHLTPLIVASGAVPVTVTFDVPQPASPRTPKASSGEGRFSYGFRDISTKFENASELTVTNLDHEGVYHLDVSVKVTETYAPDQPTVATNTISFDALAIRYEDAFYQDQRRCVDHFEHAVPLLVKQMDLVLVAPDPPPDVGSLSRLIAHVDTIRDIVGEIGRGNPSLAHDAATYAGVRLGIDPKLLLGPSRAVERST
jgi:hypothetical protein